MRKLLLVPAITLWAAASCARQEQTRVAECAMEQDKKSAGQNVPSLTPPKGLNDEWSRWLIGEWKTSTESDLPGFKCWVKGTGRMKAEFGVGGQFLVVTKSPKSTRFRMAARWKIEPGWSAPNDDARRVR